MPEAIFSHIEDLIRGLLKLLSNKKEAIADKTNEVLGLTIETLTANVILPNLVGILEEISTDPS